MTYIGCSDIIGVKKMEVNDMHKLVETKEDIKRIAKMAKGIWQEAYQALLTKDQIDYMLDKFLSVKAIKAQMNEGYQYYLLKDDIISGFASIKDMGDYLFLSKLYVYEKSRSKGLGKSFITYLIGLGKPIELTVNKHNHRALVFYEKEGFKVIKSVVSDIGNGYVMDDYVLRYIHE